MDTEERFIHSLTFADISRALARDFFRVFCVNTATNAFVEFIPHEHDESLDVLMSGSDFADMVKEFVSATYAEDLDTVRTALTKDNILKVLSEDDSFSLNYRMMMDGKATYVRVKAVRIQRDCSSHIIVALSNTDAHMQRMARYERIMQRELTYASIAEALASDYVSIYYVDINSGEYTEYKSSDDYKRLGLAVGGPDFFDVQATGFADLLFEEDRDTYLRAVNRDNLLKVLETDRLFLLTFRVVLGGEPTYVRMKITRMALEDNHHIVIGVSNVNAAMQRSAKYQEMKKLANRDSLTGVKSKHAYVSAERQLDLDVAEGTVQPFAVAVCDVNDLKIINDTLGHKAGDEHIMRACAVVCDIFKHSPVFRVGGDEFAVLLKGHDYQCRDELLESINRQVDDNLVKGDVVIAVGMAAYEPGQDQNVAAVFNRADNLMYVRKKELKAAKRADA